MRSDPRSLFFLVGHCHVQPTGVDILVAYNRAGKLKVHKVIQFYIDI